MKRYAFTMIELVFIIVILGILAAVAFPKLAPLMEDADLAKAQGDVAAIRSSISSARQKSLVQGRNQYPSALDHQGVTANSGEALFDNNGTGANDVTILQYPIYAGNASGKWRKTATNQYTFKINTTDILFTYYPTAVTGHFVGEFNCNHSGASQAAIYCRHLTE